MEHFLDRAVAVAVVPQGIRFRDGVSPGPTASRANIANRETFLFRYTSAHVFVMLDNLNTGSEGVG